MVPGLRCQHERKQVSERHMRALISSVLLALSIGNARAEPFEDGVAAHDRGDYATALRLWRPMAAQGNAAAQHNLGLMYDNGRGVPQDYIRAHLWWNLAATKGDPDSVKNRDVAAGRMTPQQIAEAQKLARECLARNYKNCD